MDATLGVVSLVGSVLGAGCCLAQTESVRYVATRGNQIHSIASGLVVNVAMLIMVLGMIDVMVFGGLLLATGLWVLAFITLGIILLPISRCSRVVVMRSFQFIAMGGAMIGMGTADASDEKIQLSAHAHTVVTSGAWQLIILAGAVAIGYCIFAGWLAMQHGSSSLMRVELFCGGLALAGMCAMFLEGIAAAVIFIFAVGSMLFAACLAVVGTSLPGRHTKGRPGTRPIDRRLRLVATWKPATSHDESERRDMAQRLREEVHRS